MYDVTKADHAVNFINCLKHTKGKWRGVPFELLSGRMRLSAHYSVRLRKMATGSTIPATVRFRRKMGSRNWRLPLHYI